MYNFMVQAYATYRGLFYWLTWISYLSNIFIGPAIFVVTYALMGRFAFDIDAARYYGIGIILNQMAFMLISGVTQAYTYDRELGTISFLYVSRANRLVNYLSRPVLHYPNGLFVFAVGLTTLWLLVGIDFSFLNWSGFVLVILVTTASIVAFSQFLSVFTIVIRDWINTMTVSLGVLFVFTGMLIPVDIFPSGVRWFPNILPITNGLAAIRSSFTGSTLGDLYPYILREAIIGLVYLLIGFLGFIFFERVVKRTGTLDRDAL
jgi:ABC-type polysaccharide/polyol phosphate export permease